MIIVSVMKRRATCPECNGGGDFAHDSVGCSYSAWQFNVEPRTQVLLLGPPPKLVTWDDLQPHDQIKIDIPGRMEHHPRRILYAFVDEVSRKKRFLRSPIVTWVSVRPIEVPTIRSIPLPPPPLPTAWTHILEDDDLGDEPV